MSQGQRALVRVSSQLNQRLSSHTPLCARNACRWNTFARKLLLVELLCYLVWTVGFMVFAITFQVSCQWAIVLAVVHPGECIQEELAPWWAVDVQCVSHTHMHEACGSTAGCTPQEGGMSSVGQST